MPTVSQQGSRLVLHSLNYSTWYVWNHGLFTLTFKWATSLCGLLPTMLPHNFIQSPCIVCMTSNSAILILYTYILCNYHWCQLLHQQDIPLCSCGGVELPHAGELSDGEKKKSCASNWIHPKQAWCKIFCRLITIKMTSNMAVAKCDYQFYCGFSTWTEGDCTGMAEVVDYGWHTTCRDDSTINKMEKCISLKVGTL